MIAMVESILESSVLQSSLLYCGSYMLPALSPTMSLSLEGLVEVTCLGSYLSKALPPGCTVLTLSRETLAMARSIFSA